MTKIKKILHSTLSIASLLFLSACGDDHDHDHDDHDHEHHEHHDHDDHHHDHDHEHTFKEGGPNGGRLIEAGSKKVEFLLLKDRFVQVSYIADGKVQSAPSGAKISVTGGDRSNPTMLSFALNGSAFKSDKALPKIDDMPIILTIQNSLSEQPVIEKFKLDTSECSHCDHLEYACICDHQH